MATQRSASSLPSRPYRLAGQSEERTYLGLDEKPIKAGPRTQPEHASYEQGQLNSIVGCVPESVQFSGILWFYEQLHPE